MKGIILVGGKGTRLFPLTFVVNKHLLPVYNKPMIYYPMSLLFLVGIKDVILVCNPDEVDEFRELFGDGSELGVVINYAVQRKPAGISDAILCTKEYVGNNNICVILGDNLFFGHGLPQMLDEAKKDVERNSGAYVFGYYVHDPHRYGIVEFDSEGNVLSLQEKPKKPRSNFAVVGLYFYDKTVFEKINKIKPSFRGELEVTSLNNLYLKEKKLKVKLLGRGFAWFDMGTYYSFLEASEFVYTIEKRTGLMIGCIEEIVYRNGWISKQQLLEIAKRYKNTDYARYLVEICNED
ncbi:MAG: glucose-1-phosphate thymidylyltransferase RfbA [Elusimicrobiota bacterium]|nr:glucose-1-phosphate thymidylyltransferase RfbA [Endomicrobiia bacterium]MDW8166395.1 glucose-1-phosphate thymidylyltransferase RfbA [Elusimicrobiota bacterium]